MQQFTCLCQFFFYLAVKLQRSFYPFVSPDTYIINSQSLEERACSRGLHCRCGDGARPQLVDRAPVPPAESQVPLGTSSGARLQHGAADEHQRLPWRSVILPKLEERALAEAHELNRKQVASKPCGDGACQQPSQMESGFPSSPPAPFHSAPSSKEIAVSCAAQSCLPISSLRPGMAY